MGIHMAEERLALQRPLLKESIDLKSISEINQPYWILERSFTGSDMLFLSRHHIELAPSSKMRRDSH